MPEAYRELDRASRRRSSSTSATCRTSSSRSRAASSTCSSAAAAKRTARAAVRVAVDMAKEGLISKRRGRAARRPGRRSTSSSTRRSTRTAPKKLLARGLAASPGAASGHIVFSADEAERRAGQGKPVILVRVETSPEDIHGMKAARGILTARGGMTSHAAVVARGMGKPCVAGVSAVAVNYETQTMTITVYDDAGRPTETVTLKKGDIITIDGGSGHVYEGAVPTVSAALTRRVRRAHGLGRRGAHDEGPRQRRHAARRPHRARASAPRASASAAPSTCSSRRSASRRCAR